MLSSSSKPRARIDFALIAIVGALFFMGFLALHSASSDTPWHLKQLGWLALSGGLGVIAAAIDYRVFERYAYLFYGGVVVLRDFVLRRGPRGGPPPQPNDGIATVMLVGVGEEDMWQ